MFPEHILTVRATVEAAREAEFNRWYDREHVPDAVRLLPGCLGAARYRVVEGDGSHQYMAVYAFPSEAALGRALHGDGIKELISLYDQDVGEFSTSRRNTYALILELTNSPARDVTRRTRPASPRRRSGSAGGPGAGRGRGRAAR